MTRGEIWWADFGIPFGSESGFNRPVIVFQDNNFNKSSINTVIVVPLTTTTILENAPGNVLIEKEISKLSKDSVAVVSQLISIDKKRLIDKIGTLNSYYIDAIEDGVILVLGIRKFR